MDWVRREKTNILLHVVRNWSRNLFMDKHLESDVIESCWQAEVSWSHDVGSITFCLQVWFTPIPLCSRLPLHHINFTRIFTVWSMEIGQNPTDHQPLSTREISAPIQKSAIVFSDIELDDKVALTMLSCSKKYISISVIVSGVSDIKGAQGDLMSFMDSLRNPLATELVVVEGENIFSDKNTPERKFQNSSCVLPILPNFESWVHNQMLSNTKNVVDVFQLAPTPAKHISLLSNIPGLKIEQFHLVHGWNSSQVQGDFKTSRSAQLHWLRNLQKELQVFHPGVDVIFTNSYGSFIPPGSGSAVPYKEFKGVLPQDHL